MTLQDYRNDKKRIGFAGKVAKGNGWDAAYVEEHLLSAHQGQHVACISCAIVALYFDVEIAVKSLEDR
jgi:hypothetical protein